MNKINQITESPFSSSLPPHLHWYPDKFQLNLEKKKLIPLLLAQRLHPLPVSRSLSTGKTLSWETRSRRKGCFVVYRYAQCLQYVHVYVEVEGVDWVFPVSLEQMMLVIE